MNLNSKQEVNSIGLKMDTNITKILSLTDYCTIPIYINEQNIGDIKQFVHLGGVALKALYLSLGCPKHVNADIPTPTS